jgi:hypothetical protein
MEEKGQGKEIKVDFFFYYEGRFLPELNEIYFTTVEKTILENFKCILPNFIND